MALHLAIMKKFVLSILALLYITASVGISFSLHYCMGKRAGWGLVHHQKDTCDKCGMAKIGGCCHDSNKVFKLDTDQQLTATYESLTPALETFVLPDYVSPSADRITSFNDRKLVFHDPPSLHGVPTHIFICVYRI
jgi:hypothetical protein